MNRFLLIAFLLSCTLIKFNCQSLEDFNNEFGKEENKLARINLYLDEARDTNHQTTLKFELAEEALALALEIDNYNKELEIYNLLANLYLESGKYVKAEKYFNKSIGPKKKKSNHYYNSIKGLGYALEMQERFPEALEFYNEYEKHANKYNLEDELVWIYNAQARSNKAINEMAVSENYYQQAYQFEQQRGNVQGTVDAANNLGVFYNDALDTIKGQQYLDTSLDISINNNYTQGVDNYYSNTNTILANRNSLDAQITLNKKALEVNTDINNPTGVGEANLNLGKINITLDNNQAALDYLQKTVDIAEENGLVRPKQEALELLSEVYQKEGKLDQAVATYKVLLELKDSLNKLKAEELKEQNELSILIEKKDDEIKYLVENDQLRKRQLEKDKALSKQRLNLIYALVGFIVVLAISVVFIIRSNRQRRIANQLLRLKSLRTQMNPHFIFNSLNSVNSFISKNDDRSANKYLTRFSNLMRMVLENSKYDLIPITDEVKMLALYVELEHLRFQDKFNYSFTVDDTLKKNEVLIPPMLIQPYIENAVWHGLRYKEEKGELKIDLKQVQNTLVCTIEDNGIGREKSDSLKTKNQLGKSTGMNNIQERLNILNDMKGTQMRVEIVDLNVENKTETGTKVIIEIPISEN